MTGLCTHVLNGDNTAGGGHYYYDCFTGEKADSLAQGNSQNGGRADGCHQWSHSDLHSTSLPLSAPGRKEEIDTWGERPWSGSRDWEMEQPGLLRPHHLLLPHRLLGHVGDSDPASCVLLLTSVTSFAEFIKAVIQV